MADNKKNNPLNAPKVKRGVKSALTPGEKPEKEQTPIEKVILGELTKIVEGINFDDKFKSIQTAIESIQSEQLLPTLNKINDKFNPILGALYGDSNINDTTNPISLLGKLGKLNTKLTMFGPIDDMLKSIYDLLATQINNKSSYKLEDLAIAVSAEITKFLKEIDNRPILESLTKTLEDMKSSILSNFSAENINRIYSQLEAISNSLPNNNTIDYTIAISDIATKIDNMANAISSTNIKNKDDSEILNKLSDISSAINTMSKTTSENIAQSTNVLKEAIGKLDLINTKTIVVDNSLLISELENIKKILTDDIVANFKQKTNVIDYSGTFKSINKSIENIVSNKKNADNNQTNSTLENELKNISKSITDLASFIVTNNSTITELQNIKNVISQLSTTIPNSLSIATEISNKLTEIIKNIFVENINTNISSIKQSINSISDSISSIKDKVISAKLLESSTENYDSSIIECISDNANAIITRIGEIELNPTINLNPIDLNPINNFTESIKNLTAEFTSRTAQIIDILNPTTKEVNTKALQYDININASGLDTNTVESLINLSKISTNSTDYLENLNNVLSNLSNFEALNNLKLDNKNIQNFVDSINALSEIKLVEDSFNSYSVDNLKYFINALSSIDLSNINQFDEDSLESISIITDMISYFSKLKLENFDKKIKSLNAEEFIELLNNLKDIPVYSKEDNTTMTAISDLFSAVSSISGFNESKFEDLSSNLRSMIKLTEKPSTFTSLKISDTGLIHILMHNIGEIAAGTKETFDNTKNIGKMLNLICGISQYDPKSFDNLKYISYILAVITSKDEPYLYKAFKNIEEIGSIISGRDAKNSPVLLMGNQLKLINSLSSNIKLKNISSLAIKSIIAWNAMYSLAKMFNYLKEISELSKNVEEYIKNINTALVGINSIESIDLNKIENLNESIKVLITSFIYLRILAFIPSKEIDISKNIDVLNTVAEGVNSIKTVKVENISGLNESLKVLITSFIYLRILAFIPSKEIDISKNITVLNSIVDQLNNIKDVKNKDNLKSLNDSIKSILTLNIWLAIVGITMPLAYIGAFAIDKEISMLSKIVGKLNEIKPIKEDVVNNLKSLSIVIVAASGILLFGALVGGFVSTHLLEILGFTVALSAFIFLTIGALNLATRGMKEAKLNVEEFGKLLLISGGIMLLGGTIMTLYAPLVLGALAFSVTLGAFIFLTIGALNLATQGMNDAAKNAKAFAILIGTCAAVMVLGGLIVTMYMPLILGSLVFTALLSLFILTTIGALNLATQGMNDAAKNAKEFAILIGISAAVMLLGGLIILNYTKIILGSLGFSLLLGAFIFLTIGALNLATKGMNDATKNAKEFAIIIGVCAATMLIGGLFMLIPGMPLAVLEFAGIFVLFLGITLFVYALASKHIKNAKETAIGFGVVVLLTSAALLIGGGMFLAFPGLDIECLKFAGISALFIAIFGVAIWLLGKIKKKDLIQGELALAGIAVLIGGFGYAFTFVAEAMDMMSKVKDPWTQLGIMGTVFGAMVALVVGVVALTTTTAGIGAAAIAAAEGLIAGVAGIIWLVGKAMSAIAQSMVDLDKVKDFDSENVVKAISNYISLIPELMPLASPEILISMLAVKSSVGSMSEAILAIATSVKAVCDLKTEDGRQLTSSDFTLAAENVKSVVTILGRSLIDIYKENEEDMFSAGTIGDLLGMDTPFSRVAKSCSTMGQLITDISAGVKDFAELRMPIYDENGKLKGYREMTETDFENAGKSIGQVVTCLGSALINVYKEAPEDMFTWELIGDNPFAIVSKSCSTLGQLITDISAGVKDFAELRMPIYDENGKIKGYREMNTVDFVNAGINVGLVITCLANAIMAVYNDPKNKNMFTDPSSWHTSADKTPFGMVTKALSGVGTLVKDGAAAIKEIADMKVDFAELEDKGSGKNIQYGKVSKIVSIIARSIKNVYDNNKDIFTDESYWHTDPQKTPFGMVTQCLNKAVPLVKTAAGAVNEISQMNFKGTDLDEKGDLYKKINGIVSVIPKAVIDVMNNEAYKEYLTDSGYLKTYENMKNVYSKFSEIITAVIGSYANINNAGYNTKQINGMKDIVKTMLENLCSVITLENIFNKPILNDSSILTNIASSFVEFNKVITEVNTAYDSINKSLSSLGVKGNDTTAITTITDNLNTMISKLSTAIRLSSISLDPVALNLFSTNVSSFYSSIDTLTRAYKLIPDDLSNYDNVVKAIEGVNFKIAEIQNLDAFEEEQQFLEKYVVTLNKLDLDKVGALSNLMSTMNELATKLGSLDRFTNVLNTKISETLTKLTKEIKISGDIINKADSLQKKRHEAIKASIKEIQSIMDKKLIVEVNHADIQSTGPDSYPSFSEPETNKSNGDSVRNSESSVFKKAADGVFGLFGGSEDNNANKNNNSNNIMGTPKRTFSNNIGGIDYDRLKEVIMEAIMQASDSAIDINRR